MEDNVVSPMELRVTLIDADEFIRYDLLPQRWFDDDVNFEAYFKFIEGELLRIEREHADVYDEENEDFDFTEFHIIVHSGCEGMSPCSYVDIPLDSLLLNHRKRLIDSHAYKPTLRKLLAERNRRLDAYESRSYDNFADGITRLLELMVQDHLQVGFISAQSCSGKSYFIREWESSPLFVFDIYDGRVRRAVNVPNVEPAFEDVKAATLSSYSRHACVVPYLGPGLAFVTAGSVGGPGILASAEEDSEDRHDPSGPKTSERNRLDF